MCVCVCMSKSVRSSVWKCGLVVNWRIFEFLVDFFPFSSLSAFSSYDLCVKITIYRLLQESIGGVVIEIGFEIFVTENNNAVVRFIAFPPFTSLYFVTMPLLQQCLNAYVKCPVFTAIY